MPEENFRMLYRLSRQAAADFFAELEPILNNGQRTTRLPPLIQFITTLHFLAQGSYQKSLAKDRHNSISQPSASRVISSVINAIIEQFHYLIKFPTEDNELINVKEG